MSNEIMTTPPILSNSTYHCGLCHHAGTNIWEQVARLVAFPSQVVRGITEAAWRYNVTHGFGMEYACYLCGLPVQPDP